MSACAIFTLQTGRSISLDVLCSMWMVIKVDFIFTFVISVYFFACSLNFQFGKCGCFLMVIAGNIWQTLIWECRMQRGWNLAQILYLKQSVCFIMILDDVLGYIFMVHWVIIRENGHWHSAPCWLRRGLYNFGCLHTTHMQNSNTATASWLTHPGLNVF